ncbi:unnamed protein product [Nippostrongylus brasiliensis]|uniref:Uncharacterized protein n=1 Tax=Nippostrongylus brasiliensis TaxID=27835 RepID=A0A0N4YH15_NIPBR|nr:unnamed protein product [Nippostrongylus brasiliensis]
MSGIRSVNPDDEHSPITSGDEMDEGLPLQESPMEAQVQELSERVRTMGSRNDPPTLSTDAKRDIEELDPHVLYAIARDKLYREKERGASFTGHRRPEEGIKNEGTNQVGQAL